MTDPAHPGSPLPAPATDSPVAAAKLRLAIVVPALNEAAVIGDQVRELLAVAADPALPVAVDRIIVVDNGSTDATAAVARAAGATVVPEPRRGYGRACLSGVEAAAGCDLIALMDGDRSDDPADLSRLLAPLLASEADLVLGSRPLGKPEPGALTLQQLVGNQVAAIMLRALFGVRVTDIGPFRVIRREQLLALGMREMTYGWSVEMIARAARAGLRVREVPVAYRKRAGGESKVSGTVQGSIRAGGRIIATIVRCRWSA